MMYHQLHGIDNKQRYVSLVATSLKGFAQIMAPREPKAKATKEFRDLLVKHDIEILGPVSPSDYPKQHKSLFNKVYDIAYSFKFNNYIAPKQRSSIPAADMARRVLMLKNAAYDCRRMRVNERTWRSHIEHHVLTRFESQLQW
jgi:hypothetical protein